MRVTVLNVACVLSAALVLAPWVTFGRGQRAEGQWQSGAAGNVARQLTYSATVALLGKPTPIRLVFVCDPTQTRTEHGALGFDLFVSNPAALAPFAFDDFEGPDAPGLKKPRLAATVTRAGKPPAVFSFAPSGWYPGDGGFAFGVSAQSDQPASQPRRLLDAIAQGADRLQIAITDVRNPRLVLDFSVPVAGQASEFRALLSRVTPR